MTVVIFYTCVLDNNPALVGAGISLREIQIIKSPTVTPRKRGACRTKIYWLKPRRDFPYSPQARVEMGQETFPIKNGQAF